MIGLIFHWGLYSVPCYDDITSASRRKIQNGSEWYYKRLIEKGKFRPVSGFKETQKFHKEHYGDREYKDFVSDFKCENWNPDEWMQLAVDVGATYVIITAKHHDAFCLWDTKTSDYNSVKNVCGRDLVNEFVISARKFSLRVGIYYSWLEFDSGCTKIYLAETVKEQIMELLKYNPDIWWFDGDWTCTTQFSKSFIKDICIQLKNHNPNVEINDRIALDNKKDINYLGESTYRVYSDREIPDQKPTVKWEHINTIGYSWGRNHTQQQTHYKTGVQLYQLYQKVSEKSGNFLLNLGPNSDGSLDPYEVNSLLKFGQIYKNQ